VKVILHSETAMQDALATTVYVGGLAPGTRSEALAACFAPRVVVHAVFVRTFGFVTFALAAQRYKFSLFTITLL
jgi:hypothetical protein